MSTSWKQKHSTWKDINSLFLQLLTSTCCSLTLSMYVCIYEKPVEGHLINIYSFKVAAFAPLSIWVMSRINPAYLCFYPVLFLHSKLCKECGCVLHGQCNQIQRNTILVAFKFILLYKMK